MKVLELFAGTRSIGKAFESRGDEVTSVDCDERFEDCLHTDAYSFLVEHGEEYDVIWASPCCITYSVAGIRLHRVKDDRGRFCEPLTEYAKECDRDNEILFKWFNEHRDKIWFIENPRANMQHMRFAECLNDLKTEVCYCQYGDRRKKPTNIWTTVKDSGFLMCPGASCNHWRSKGGMSDIVHSKKDRGAIPDMLCNYIVEICHREMNQ